MIVLITGSSASGKTTIAKLLEKHNQFHHIDGDQVIRDLGLTSKSWNSIHDDLIDRVLQFDTDAKVVISHVVLPEKFEYCCSQTFTSITPTKKPGQEISSKTNTSNRDRLFLPKVF